jgi:hypothetical protein
MSDSTSPTQLDLLEPLWGEGDSGCTCQENAAGRESVVGALGTDAGPPPSLEAPACRFLACGKPAKGDAEGWERAAVENGDLAAYWLGPPCGDHIPHSPEVLEDMRLSWGFAGGTSDNERRMSRAGFEQSPLVTVARVGAEGWMGKLRVEELERIHPGVACAGCEKCSPRRR